VFLVALGVDYNIFLITRVQEESKEHGTRRGALIGLNATGGVITSAGIVLAGTFAALTTLPLTFAVEIGFAVAFGVLLDTFIVRSVLVTALTYDIGRWMWWPAAMSRDSREGGLHGRTRHDLAQTPGAYPASNRPVLEDQSPSMTA
jgi:RND superfamily putative drug exporter